MKPRRELPAIVPAREPATLLSLLEACLAASAVGLAIATTLVPSEGVVRDGTYAAFAAGWCVVGLLWAVLLLAQPRATIWLGWTELVGGLFVLWHSLAALIWLGHSNDRQSLNALWLVVGYGLTAFVLRQIVRNRAQARALVAVMIWLATTLAGLGYVQYFVTMPAILAEFQRDPEQILTAAGISTDPNSPERQAFENRIKSVEPLATFSLTNSLAGLLAPWLIATLAIGLAILTGPSLVKTEIANKKVGSPLTSSSAARWRRWPSRPLVGVCLLAATIAGCLLLTKSRTAVLAVAAGLMLLLLYGRQGGWRIGWRIPAIAAAAVAVLGLGAVFAGGLDVEVLSEAPKSLLYRLEYWRSTAALIADHPLWGCGPGGFQEAYAAYKLPQASELVAEPHNLPLEIWATAGTPAVLLALALAVAVAVDLMRLAAGRQPTSVNPDSDAARQPTSPMMLYFGGGGVGLILGAILAAINGFPLTTLGALPVPVVWCVGLPLLALVWWLLQPWIEQGKLPLGAVVVAGLVLLINLLAAGAFVFPGVIVTLLVLWPVAAALAAEETAAPAKGSPGSFCPRRLPAAWNLYRQAALGVAATAGLLTIACLLTEYRPVLQSRLEFGRAQALLRSDGNDSRKAAIAAASADPAWPEPWQWIASIHHSQFLRSRDPSDWQQFLATEEQFRRRNPRHHGQFHQRGNWHFWAWQLGHQPVDLEASLAAYREAVKRYPNHARYHAQLGWALNAAGQSEAARAAAEVAKRLDDAMPHRDQKLSLYRLADLQIAADGSLGFQRPETAEQTIASLRKTRILEEQP